MTSGGIQTHDFMRRLQQLEESSLAPLLLELARVMESMIREIENPELEDVRKLQAAMRHLIGDAALLRAVCGTAGELCGQCPFGAYLPSGFPYASEKQALCIPWIAVVHPIPEAPPAAEG
ncbi:MAG: hypothetical protein WCF59_01355 [Desulfobaccales bacterium]|jgi:hypothetical protein